jgi:hypothetical protein
MLLCINRLAPRALCGGVERTGRDIASAPQPAERTRHPLVIQRISGWVPLFSERLFPKPGRPLLEALPGARSGKVDTGFLIARAGKESRAATELWCFHLKMSPL